jgi:hypothetical protein
MHTSAELRSALLVDLRKAEVPWLTSDMDLATARCASLSNAFLKKSVDDISPGADDACLSLFEKANSACEAYSLRASKLFHDEVIGEVKHILDDIFFSGPDLLVSSSDFDELIGVGPGAAIGARSFNFYTKLFDSTLSYTDSQLPVLYARAISSNPTWALAEKQRAQKYGFRMVEGNRLSFVPKTASMSRSICTEPSLNMLFQRGLGLVFERLLRRHFRISLSTQPDLNKNLARLGSLDGSFGTIDLKSASDSVSLTLLKQILPAYVYSWLVRFRSPSVTLPGGRSLQLHMVSSMGNGFTFPLQTLIFATIVRACYRVLGIKSEYVDGKPSNFGIFGDDIIVRKDAYAFVVDCLGLFGFTVNDEKSFNVGPFRESCGGDFFKGAEVRGVYVKSLKHRTDVYSTINRLMRWSSLSGVMLPTVMKLLTPRVRFLPVPWHASDAEGIKIPRKFLIQPALDETGCTIYRALSPVPVSFKAPSGEAERPRFYPGRQKRFITFNADGVVVSLVGGYIRNGRITLRSEDSKVLRRFKVRYCKTPHWDFYRSAAEKQQVHDWEVMYELMHPLGCFDWAAH